MKKRGKCGNPSDAMGAEEASQADAFALAGSPRLPCQAEDSHSELLILPDGRILVHNLTPVFADLLVHMNPNEEQITARTRPPRLTPHELPH
jgi:hypothetical protein